jgi:hypothetical protein
MGLRKTRLIGEDEIEMIIGLWTDAAPRHPVVSV